MKGIDLLFKLFHCFALYFAQAHNTSTDRRKQGKTASQEIVYDLAKQSSKSLIINNGFYYLIILQAFIENSLTQRTGYSFRQRGKSKEKSLSPSSLSTENIVIIHGQMGFGERCWGY